MQSLGIIILSLLILSSCAFFDQISGAKGKGVLQADKQSFLLTDKAGQFKFVRESGFQKGRRAFVLKTQVTSPDGDQSKVLEQSVTISEIGKLKNRLPVLRPKIAQYTVWFNKQKYFSQLKTNVKKKSLEITMRSPEKNWNGVKEIDFPGGTGVFCYYSQLIECARVTGFIHRAIDEKTGSMNFIVIWDGYPYFHEQYVNIPKEVFSSASLSYDGEGPDQTQRFTLEVAGQQVFYSVDEAGRYLKQFWVAQGLTIAVPGSSRE